MIQENGGMHHMKHGIGDTSLNITNSLSAGFAFSHGLDIVTLSIEHDENSIKIFVMDLKSISIRKEILLCRYMGMWN